MEKLDLTIDTSYLKNEEAWRPLKDEELYTLHMTDFLKMPAMNFTEIATIDPFVKALFN